jgi:hypothetical protein
MLEGKSIVALSTHYCHNNHSTILFTDDGSGSIKDGLIDELDYVLVPSESWDLLVKWYGTLDQNTAIARQVSFNHHLAHHVDF